MNLYQLFESIAAVDENTPDRFDTRRAAFGRLFAAGKKISLAAAPVFLSTLFQRAYAGEQHVQETVSQVLAYALRLERLEYAFYAQALASPTLALTTSERAGLTTIRSHEQSHVALLEAVLGPANLPPPDTYRFDKVYANVFSSRDTFLAVAQALEDTGVRAYKGRAAELKVDPSTLEIAFTIQAVEARHAAHIRQLRGEQAWITNASTTIPSVSSPQTGVTIPGNAFYLAGNPAAAFPSEANTTQGSLSGLYAGNGIAADRYTEAFDEPLDRDTVLTTIATLFL